MQLFDYSVNYNAIALALLVLGIRIGLPPATSMHSTNSGRSGRSVRLLVYDALAYLLTHEHLLAWYSVESKECSELLLRDRRSLATQCRQGTRLPSAKRDRQSIHGREDVGCGRRTMCPRRHCGDCVSRWSSTGAGLGGSQYRYGQKEETETLFFWPIVELPRPKHSLHPSIRTQFCVPCAKKPQKNVRT